MIHLHGVKPTVAPQLAAWSECSAANEADAAGQLIMESETGAGETTPKLSDANLKSLNVGLIDFHRFAEDCLLKALDELHPRTSISSFATVEDFAAKASHDLDFVMYHLHGGESSDAGVCPRHRDNLRGVSDRTAHCLLRRGTRTTAQAHACDHEKRRARLCPDPVGGSLDYVGGDPPRQCRRHVCARRSDAARPSGSYTGPKEPPDIATNGCSFPTATG